jgi:hypothetical protein
MVAVSRPSPASPMRDGMGGMKADKPFPKAIGIYSIIDRSSKTKRRYKAHPIYIVVLTIEWNALLIWRTSLNRKRDTPHKYFKVTDGADRRP